jgi:hypothetical protein
MRYAQLLAPIGLALAAAAQTDVRPFGVAAWVDHFDYAAVQRDGKFLFDTETPQGIAAVLDHVQETGATTILWRNCCGGTMRYQSVETSHHGDSQLDKRRVLDDRPVFGWVRYGETEPDIIRTVVGMCRERGLRPGIHWPFEENHWALFTIGRWNLEHPQYWGRTVDGQPWAGRVSLAFEPVVEHKLRLVDELLDRGVECLFLDFFRNGGWGPHAEYVEPLVTSYRQQYGEAPPSDPSDPRWVRHVAASVTAYIRRLHDHVKQRNPRFELLVGLPNVAPGSDRNLVESVADWRTWVDEGLIDTLVVNSVAWDARDPLGTTRDLYRQILAAVGGRCQVLLPVCAYNYHERGMPAYEQATGRSQAELARDLTMMAWEEGAAGISLECVDFENYDPSTRQVLRELEQGACRTVRERASPAVPPPGPVAAVPIASAPAPSSVPARGLAAGVSVAPVPLTAGPGNDTEAAWSPDGTRIVFQSDRGGSLGLYLLDLRTQETTPLVSGPGHACFPAWSPDGRWIAYAYAHFTGTAVQGIENGYNLFVIPSAGGEARRLTAGLCRDYTPTFSRDGQQVIFASTRSSKDEAASVGLFAVPLAGGALQPLLPTTGADAGAVQPDLSPDGELLAYGFVSGFRSNWGLRLAKVKAPRDSFPLTDGEAPFYGPRWSPKGRQLACTGYVAGDPGWGIHLLDAATGARRRLECGPGNSRSPAWSPDGRELVFENNRSGTYKLCRVVVPALPAAAGPEEAQRPPAEAEAGAGGAPVLSFSFREQPGTTVRDLSGRGNDATLEGEVTWQNGAVSFAPKGSITVSAPRGCDFAEGAFAVRATVEVTAHNDKLRIIAVGEYPGNRNGWQLYLADNNQAWFNSRSPQLNFVGAISDGALPVGRKVTLVGVRYRTGTVRLFVDGVRQVSAGVGASYRYPVPERVRLGGWSDGQGAFAGRLYDIAVYPRALTPAEIGVESLQEFLAR